MSTHGAATTSSSRTAAPQPIYPHQAIDPTRLAPDDAFHAYSPPKRGRERSPLGINGIGSGQRATSDARRNRNRRRSRSRRRKGTWKKLLWVKQSYPDNYTDTETFLDHLQRNPRLQPYEFWPLVADSTVIVQHIASVVIFVCCFTVIFQERVSPITVVSYGSLATVLGWFLWDFWVGQEEANKATAEIIDDAVEAGSTTSSSNRSTNGKDSGRDAQGPELLVPSVNAMPNRRPPANASTMASATTDRTTEHAQYPAYEPVSSLSPRNQQRLATFKSAVLIYCALLGLSPILKSLTESTSSDSIWAMSTFLFGLNVFFFDYGGEPGAKFPASLSTNAAVMSSTVLASRLPSTTHVFSLTLFSIEIFGLFPVFRRYLRHISWRGHIYLTIFLVVCASGGLAATVSGGGWLAAIVGVVLGGWLWALAIGLCVWWLIGLQKYKNEIYGPWDPARPVIRRRWD